MKDSWILVSIIIVIITAILSLKKKSKNIKKIKKYKKEEWPFYKEKSLLEQETLIYEKITPTIKDTEKELENLKNQEWPFYQKKPLTNPEQILYHRLIEALPEYIVLSQVQLSRFLGVKKGFNFNEWNNRINRMSIIKIH